MSGSAENTGRAWVYGDNVDTDLLAPGAYMKGPVETMATHCLEAIDLDFAKTAKAGDIVVGGRNFGMGSSREQAAQVLGYWASAPSSRKVSAAFSIAMPSIWASSPWSVPRWTRSPRATC